MKKLLSIILIISTSLAAYAQPNIKSVGAGEYATGYLTEKGEVFQVVWSSPLSLEVRKINVPTGNKINGNQYSYAVTTVAGEVYDVNVDGIAKKLNVSNVAEAWGMFQNTVVIFKDGTLGLVNTSNQLTKFNQPNGKFFKKVVISANDNLYFKNIFALTTDGILYKYTLNSSAYSTVLMGCTDVAAIAHQAVVASTANDLVFIEGYDGRYVGLPYGVKYQTSIKQYFSAAAWPYKQMIGNYTTLHIIDANNEMWGIGDNPMGEIGNGEGIRYTNDEWDWANLLKQTPLTKISGKWKNINTSPILAFYLYAQDLNNNWFSWGRNKTRALGNGINLRDYTIGSDLGGDKRPNYLDVWTPTHVQPLNVTWQVVKFDATKIPQAPTIPLPNPIDSVPPRIDPNYHDSVVAVLTAKIAGKDAVITNLNAQIQALMESMILFKEELEAVIKKH